MRCAAPWRDLPERFGKWKSVYSAFRRFIENGLFEAALAALQSVGADLEMVMVDSSGCRAHQDASGPEGGQQAQAMGRTKGGLSTKIHMACDALGYPLGFHLSAANESDYGNCKPLLESYLPEGAYALMDKGYDSDANRGTVDQLGGIAVIAVNASRSKKPAFDKHVYKERHKIENLFGRLKRYRRIATRYEKLAKTYAAFVTLACAMIWLKL